MTEKTPNNKIKKIYKLYFNKHMKNKHMKIKAIASKVRVSYVTTRVYIRLKELGMSSPKEYRDSSVPGGSTREYNKNNLKKRGFKTENKYALYVVKKKGYKTRAKYAAYLANKKGKTLTESVNLLIKKRQQKPQYKEVAGLIKSKLKELGKKQVELAMDTGVSYTVISNYVNAKNIPKKKYRDKLEEVLGLKEGSIDKIVNLAI